MNDNELADADERARMEDEIEHLHEVFQEAVKEVEARDAEIARLQAKCAGLISANDDFAAEIERLKAGIAERDAANKWLRTTLRKILDEAETGSPILWIASDTLGGKK